MSSYEITSSRLYWAFAAIVLVQMVPQTTAILGGEDALMTDFPFIASVRTGNIDACTGVILSRRYILTAAHCTTVKPADPNVKFYPIVIRNDMNVMVGVTSREEGRSISQSRERQSPDPIRRVDSVTIYNKFKTPTHLYYDLALLRLSEDLQYTQNVTNIELSTTKLPLNSDVTIAGWGHKVQVRNRQEIISRQDKLQRTTTKAKKCPNAYNGDLILCLQRTASHRTTGGDSGGPVIYNGKLVGIMVSDDKNMKVDAALKLENKEVIQWIRTHTGL